MEQSGLEHKLKQRLKKSADGSNTAAAAAAAGYQPAQLDRHMQQRGKRKHGVEQVGRPPCSFTPEFAYFCSP
jgi:hypothetical protein